MTRDSATGDHSHYDASQVRRQSVRGGSITLLSQAVSVALHLTSAIVLARLLGPEEFGTIAMVTAITAFAGVFRDLGLSSSTIQSAQLTHRQFNALYWINVAAGATISAIVAILSPTVAWFYDRPELFEVTLALSLNFVIGSFGTQPGALQIRQMRFGRHAIATVSGSILTLVVATMMAIQGFSYWALVFGSLAGTALTSSLHNALCEWAPGFATRGSGVRKMLGFGTHVTAFGVVNYFARNLDNILIGRMWGAESLGLYSRAYQLLMVPITNLRGPIRSVAFPAMSRLQNQPDEFRRYYRDVVSVLAFLSMPVTSFIFVASDPIIGLVLGNGWIGVVPLFSVLALVAFIQPCASTAGLVCLSLGLGRRLLMIGATGALITAVGFMIGVKWGPLGVAISYAVTTYLALVPIMVWTYHGTPLRLVDFFRSIQNPLLASIVAGGLVWMLRLYTSDLPDLQALVLLTTIFGMTYFGAYALLPRGKNELKRMMRPFDSLRRKVP